MKKITKAKIFFHRGTSIKEARSIVNTYDNLDIEYSGHDGHSVFVDVIGPESLIRSLLLNSKIKSVSAHTEGPTKKRDLIRSAKKEMPCKFCKEVGYVWLGYTTAKAKFHCRKCDSFWEEYKVFDENWTKEEINTVRTYISLADEWRWYKGKNLLSAWRKGDKNEGVITAKNLTSLIEKVADSIIKEKLFSDEQNVQTLHNMF
jgi:hypothetical protein